MPKRFTTNKDVNKLLNDLVDNGYIVKNSKKHVKVYDKKDILVTTVSTSISDWRGIIKIKKKHKELIDLVS